MPALWLNGVSSAWSSAEQVQLLKEKNIPFVLLDQYFPDMQTDFVSTDHYKAAYDGVNNLITNGYQRIGMIAYKSAMFHMQERIRGYQDALKDYRMPFQKNWLKKAGFSHIEPEVKTAIDELTGIEQPTDELIFATYGLAVNGLKYVNELNLNVPDDLAIISFGQAEAFDLYYCPITYLKKPIELLGQTAVRVLVEKMKNQPKEFAQIHLKAELITRASSTLKIVA